MSAVGDSTAQRAAGQYNRLIVALQLLADLYGPTECDDPREISDLTRQIVHPIAESVAPHLRLMVAHIVLEDGDAIAGYLATSVEDPPLAQSASWFQAVTFRTDGNFDFYEALRKAQPVFAAGIDAAARRASYSGETGPFWATVPLVPNKFSLSGPRIPHSFEQFWALTPRQAEERWQSQMSEARKDQSYRDPDVDHGPADHWWPEDGRTSPRSTGSHGLDGP